MNKAKDIILSILLSIVWLAGFYLITFLALLIIVPIFVFILELPVMSTIVNLLFSWADAYISDFVYGLSAFLAIAAIRRLAEKIIKNENIHSLSLKISGLSVVTLNAIFLIVNIIVGNPVIANVIFAISGFYLAFAEID